MVGVQVRTIFLAVRGVNMLGNALQKPRQEMTELEKSQADLQRRTYGMMFAGAAFLTFGAFMMKAMSGLAGASSKGAIMLDDLGLAWGRLSSKLGAGIAKGAEDQVHALIDLMGGLGNMEGLGEKLFLSAEVILGLGAGLIALSGIAKAIGIISAVGKMSIAFDIATVSGAGISQAIIAALGAVGITASFGAGVLVIGVTLSLIKFGLMAWDWSKMNETQQKAAADAAARNRGYIDEKGRTRIPFTGTAENPAQNQTTINIYGNTFGSDLDERKVADEIGNEINNLGMPRP